MSEDKVRHFDTGATRSQDASRIDPEAYLSPIVIERYCEYLNKHRTQPDGSTRDPDNWQRGIPLSAYVKGLWRHMLHLWTRHRGFTINDPGAAENIEEDLCALIFNAQGYLFEVLKEKRKAGDRPVRGVNTPVENVDGTFGAVFDTTDELRKTCSPHQYAVEMARRVVWSQTPPAQTGWYRHRAHRELRTKVTLLGETPISVAYYEAHKCLCVLLAGKPIPVSEIGGWWLGPFDTYAEAEKAK